MLVRNVAGFFLMAQIMPIFSLLSNDFFAKYISIFLKVVAVIYLADPYRANTYSFCKFINLV